MDRHLQTFKECMGELQQLFIPVWHKSKMVKRAKPWPAKEIRENLRKKHTNWPRKIIGLRVGSSLEFSKEGPRD